MLFTPLAEYEGVGKMDLIISEWFNLVLQRPFKAISAHVNKVRRLKCQRSYFYQEHEPNICTQSKLRLNSFGRPYKPIVVLEPSYRYVSRMSGHKMCLPWTKDNQIVFNNRSFFGASPAIQRIQTNAGTGFRENRLTRVIGRPLLWLDGNTDVVR